MKTVNVKSLGECPYLISLEGQDVIGHGSYAKVCRAFNKKCPEERLAAKIFDVHDVKKFESAYKQLMIVSELPRHQNLIQYKKVKITSKNKIYIIMELCESNLKKKIKQKIGYFDENQIWQFLIEFSQGYKILNKKQIIHRDIKPDNILIGYDGKYKVSDFGLSQIISQLKKDVKIKGSLCYLAPQLLNGSKENISDINDVYSLGVTVYEMCFKNIPYLKNINKLQSIAKYITQVKYNPLKFTQNHPYSNELINLISSMLQKQQSKRCTWQYIFYILMQKSIQKSVKNENLPYQIQNIQRKFKIIQISDALLKNLSSLDTNLYNSLKNESLAIIDHIQAQIIAKRQIVYYCDRLQYRLSIISQKSNFIQFQNFRLDLLVYTYFQSQHLQNYFEKYYQKIQKSQFMKIVTSQKYQFIRNLIKQDYFALKSQLYELINRGKYSLDQNKQNIKNNENRTNNKTQNNSSLQVIETKTYEKCFDIIIKLYSFGYYQQCKQVDELQIWLDNKQKSKGILSKLRKNQNSLKEFDMNLYGVTNEKIKQYISQNYLYYFNKIDKNKIK